MFFGVDVEGFVFNGIGMFESLHDKEVGFESREVLIVKGKSFHCEFFSILSFLALTYDSVRSFPEFLKKNILFLK